MAAGRFGASIGGNSMSGAPEAQANDVIEELLALPGYRVAPDMHRWFWLRGRLADEGWLDALDAIRVTGSNGKGSTCVMLDAVLSALGVSTGRITSPHLFRFNERITVEGEPISDLELERAVRWARARAAEHLEEFGADLNAYETIIAAALHHFSERRPELVISEAGKGGRFDPGWVFPSRLAALTSVDLEHTTQLGSTRLEIACHKADICPPGGTLVVGSLDGTLLRQLATYTSMRGIELVPIRDVARWRIERQEPDGMVLDLHVDGIELPELGLGLVGEHQASNAAVALALAWRWLVRHRPALEPAAFVAAARETLGRLRFPGRFTRVREHPEVFLDVAHTPDGAQALAETIAGCRPTKPVLLVLGSSAHREPEELIRPLLAVASELVVTRSWGGDRAHDPQALERAVVRVAPELPVRWLAEVEDAAGYALARAGAGGMRVVVAGGHAIVSELALALEGRDPRSIRRFTWLR